MCNVTVNFTKAGMRQLRTLSKNLNPIIVCKEVSQYINYFSQANKPLDMGGQELCFDKGVYIILRCMSGIWYITDIWMIDTTRKTFPVAVYGWERIRKGCGMLLCKVLMCWRQEEYWDDRAVCT